MTRVTEVASPKNPLVARLRRAAGGEEPEFLVVEGVRILEEAIASGLQIAVAAVGTTCLESPSGRALRERLIGRAEELVLASDPAMAKMSSLTTPPGALALVRRPTASDEALCGGTSTAALIVAAAGVRDPGNLGAMLRTTEAAGGTGFVALAGSADPFREKAVRGSSGSILRLPTRAGMQPEGLLAFAKSRGLAVVVADGHANTDYFDLDLARPSILVLGSEGHGVPQSLRTAATTAVRIPIRATVESLNVAVATGVLLFEARRQRGIAGAARS
ncbi:MAG: TrmH family RNA methyltransferase [Planctomycetota bacterium]